ncbi:MAG: hypothetical protein V3R16_02935 [Nitrospirales bacterium]
MVGTRFGVNLNAWRLRPVLVIEHQCFSQQVGDLVEQFRGPFP